MANMDDIIRRLVEAQYTAPAEGIQLRPGLLGNPSNDSSQEYSAGVNVDTPMTVEGVDVNQSAPVTFQGGLLGQTPASQQQPQVNPVENNAQQALEQLSAKGQQSAQQMAQMQQEANQQGIQAAQNLQAKRDSEMQNTQEQARQALERQQQQASGLGNLLGMGLKLWLTGGTGVWGKKK